MEVKDKVVTAEGLKGAYDNLNGKITQLNSDLQTQTYVLDLSYGRLKFIKQLGIVHVITLSMIYIPENVAAHERLVLGTITDINFLPSKNAYITSSNTNGGKSYPGTLGITSDGTVFIINTSDLKSNMYSEINGIYTTLS